MWRLNAQFDSKIVEDIFEMRICFKPRASFLAARHGSDDDLQLIERRYRELASAYASPSAQSDVRATVEGTLVSCGNRHDVAERHVHYDRQRDQGGARVSSEMLYRQAAKPSEDIVLHDAVRCGNVSRQPEEASAAMTRLLEASHEKDVSIHD